MSHNYRILSFAAVIALVGTISANIAFAADTPAPQSQAARAAVPLPQDRQDALAGNPAQPNCYPDINHCTSYASGNVSKENPLQQPPQPKQAEPKKSQ
jgi:hypothetical protein